jgi:hypothetical protein
MELLEQAPVFTTPKNALSSTLHFSMFRPFAPSLDMLVTYGPAVVQPAKRMVKQKAIIIFGKFINFSLEVGKRFL